MVALKAPAAPTFHKSIENTTRNAIASSTNDSALARFARTEHPNSTTLTEKSPGRPHSDTNAQSTIGNCLYSMNPCDNHYRGSIENSTHGEIEKTRLNVYSIYISVTLYSELYSSGYSEPYSLYSPVTQSLPYSRLSSDHYSLYRE